MPVLSLPTERGRRMQFWVISGAFRSDPGPAEALAVRPAVTYWALTVRRCSPGKAGDEPAPSGDAVRKVEGDKD